MPGSDLEIFLPVLGQQAVVQPVRGERLAGVRLGLDELVLVVREDQVEPAAVDVEVAAEVLHAHGRALDVPAGPARPPGAVPRRLARLRALPQGEVAGMPLDRRGLDPRAGQQLFGVAVAELAVVGGLGHVEIDVAGRLVGKALVDQRLGDRDDLGDVLGGARHVVDAVDAERRQAVEVVGRHALGQLLDRRPVFLGLHDQLVVDVGDVHHPGHLVAEVDQVALDRVEDHRPDHVADVAGRVDRRPADVHADLAGLRRSGTAPWSGSVCYRRGAA